MPQPIHVETVMTAGELADTVLKPAIPLVAELMNQAGKRCATYTAAQQAAAYTMAAFELCRLFNGNPAEFVSFVQNYMQPLLDAAREVKHDSRQADRPPR